MSCFCLIDWFYQWFSYFTIKNEVFHRYTCPFLFLVCEELAFSLLRSWKDDDIFKNPSPCPSIRSPKWFFSFNPLMLMWWIDFLMLNWPYIPGVNPIWLWCIFVHLGLGLSIFCLGFFSYLFMCEISLGYLFFLLLTWCAFDIKFTVSFFSGLSFSK